MVDLHYERGEETPEIRLASAENHFLMRGQAFPENALRLFQPVFDALQESLPALPGGQLTVDLDLTYFNSSSAKALMRLSQILDRFAADGGQVHLRWHFPEDDEALKEFGEDLAEDLEGVEVVFCPRGPA